MKKIKNKILHKLLNTYSIFIGIILVAIFSTLTQKHHINNDALIYIKQAYFFAEGDFKSGLSIYPWPFYGLIIAWIHNITNIQFFPVAHIINIILFGLTSFFYLKTIELIYKLENVVLFGALLLLSYFPLMDDYVPMIIRDHGFWAGCMMGSYYYFKNLKFNNFRNKILIQFGFLFSALFRPEGFLFLITLPLWNLYINKKQKFLNLVQDSLLIFFLFFLILIVILFKPEINFLEFVDASRFVEFFYKPSQIFFNYTKMSLIISENRFLSDLINDNKFITISGMIFFVAIFKWVKGLGFLHGIVFINFLKNIKKDQYQKHLIFFLSISFFYVILNLFSTFIISNRFFTIHWMWLFILITPSLHSFFYRQNNKINYFLKIAITIIVILSILNCFYDSKKMSTDHYAAQYLNKNIQNKSVSFIYSERVGYYAGYKIDDIFSHGIQNQSRPIDVDWLIFYGDKDGLQYYLEINNIIDNYSIMKSFKDKKYGFYFLIRNNDY